MQLKQNLEAAVLTGSKWCRFHNVPRQIIPPTREELSSLVSVLHFILHLILNLHLPDTVFIKLRLTKLLDIFPTQTAEPQRHHITSGFFAQSLQKLFSTHCHFFGHFLSCSFLVFFDMHFKNRFEFYYWVSKMQLLDTSQWNQRLEFLYIESNSWTIYLV